MSESHEDLVGLPDRDLRLRAGEATHQHYKGGLYRLLGPLMDADTGLPVPAKHPRQTPGRVVYEHVYPHERQLWVRDREEFEEDLPDGRPRFRLLGTRRSQ